jgi:hypothetical protein
VLRAELVESWQDRYIYVAKAGDVELGYIRLKVSTIRSPEFPPIGAVVDIEHLEIHRDHRPHPAAVRLLLCAALDHYIAEDAFELRGLVFDTDEFRRADRVRRRHPQCRPLLFRAWPAFLPDQYVRAYQTRVCRTRRRA